MSGGVVCCGRDGDLRVHLRATRVVPGTSRFHVFQTRTDGLPAGGLLTFPVLFTRRIVLLLPELLMPPPSIAAFAEAFRKSSSSPTGLWRAVRPPPLTRL